MSSGAEHVKAEANRLIAYHSPISRALTDERTSLESKLIPVSAYIVTACIESWYRYPEMMRIIDAARPAQEIGRAARRPGSRINTVHLWSIANFWLVGRKVMAMILPGQDDPTAAHTVLDFWERAAMAFRGGDGTRQAWDSGDARPYDDPIVAELLAGTVPVGDAERARIKPFNATLVAYLFLLYFDTRVGSGDTGPYRLPDGKVLLVRDFYQTGKSDFWWSDVAADVPYGNLTAAMVLDDVSVRITDFGTSYTDPEDYLDRVVAYGLFTTDAATGALIPIGLDEIEAIIAAVRKAQSALYRSILAMSRDEKIRCGGYVYFSFLRPFALAAGVEDQLDWTVPRDIPPPIYDLVSQMEGGNAPTGDDGDYYSPIA